MTGLAVIPTTTSFNGNALAGAAVTLTNVTVNSCGATQPTACDGDHDGHDGGHDGHDGHHDGHDKEHCDNGQHNGHDKDPFGSNDEHGDKGDK